MSTVCKLQDIGTPPWGPRPGPAGRVTMVTLSLWVGSQHHSPACSGLQGGGAGAGSPHRIPRHGPERAFPLQRCQRHPPGGWGDQHRTSAELWPGEGEGD